MPCKLSNVAGGFYDLEYSNRAKAGPRSNENGKRKLEPLHLLATFPRNKSIFFFKKQNGINDTQLYFLVMLKPQQRLSKYRCQKGKNTCSSFTAIFA